MSEMEALVEFLLARIAEDEKVTRTNWNRGGVTDERWWGTPFQPSRILAECDAKRRIVDGYEAIAGEDEAADAVLEGVLMCLALPYADHPDYRQEWRP